MFLIDTNVLVELSKGSRCDPNVAAWNSLHSPSSMFISVISLAGV